MNGAHWHLVVNHLPIIFPMVGVLVLVTGLVFKSEAVKRTAFMVMVLGALGAAASMATGEGAEEVVENVSGVTENFIEAHEETAELFAILSYVLGALSLVSLWASWKQKSFSTLLSLATLVFAVVVLYLGKQTGTTGGEIRHTEIRAGGGTGTGTQMDNAEDDEDD